jgi:hypothetical protein
MDYNPYAKKFIQAFQRIKENPSIDLNICLKTGPQENKTYCLPTSEEIAFFIPTIGDISSDYLKNIECNIIIRNKTNQLLKISENHSAYDLLHCFDVSIWRFGPGSECASFSKKKSKQMRIILVII